MNLEILCITVIVILLLIRPNLLKDFSNSSIGRFAIVVLIVGATTFKTYLGVLLVVLLVSLNQIETIEGMSNNSDKKGKVDSTSTQREAQKFRETNCKGNVLYKDKDNSNVSIDQVEKMFPTVRFTNDKCNPCDTSCQFSISKSREQLATHESLGRGAGVSSKQFRTGKITSDNEVSATPSLNKTSKKSSPARTPVDQ
jgi:hypothetical protein